MSSIGKNTTISLNEFTRFANKVMEMFPKGGGDGLAKFDIRTGAGGVQKVSLRTACVEKDSWGGCDIIGAFFRSAATQKINNDMRKTFVNAISEKYGSEFDLKRLAPAQLKELKLEDFVGKRAMKAAMKADEPFTLEKLAGMIDSNGTGKPLSVRRIIAISDVLANNREPEPEDLLPETEMSEEPIGESIEEPTEEKTVEVSNKLSQAQKSDIEDWKRDLRDVFTSEKDDNAKITVIKQKTDALIGKLNTYSDNAERTTRLLNVLVDATNRMLGKKSLELETCLKGATGYGEFEDDPLLKSIVNTYGKVRRECAIDKIITDWAAKLPAFFDKPQQSIHNFTIMRVNLFGHLPPESPALEILDEAIVEMTRLFNKGETKEALKFDEIINNKIMSHSRQDERAGGTTKYHGVNKDYMLKKVMTAFENAKGGLTEVRKSVVNDWSKGLSKFFADGVSYYESKEALGLLETRLLEADQTLSGTPVMTALHNALSRAMTNTNPKDVDLRNLINEQIEEEPQLKGNALLNAIVDEFEKAKKPVSA